MRRVKFIEQVQSVKLRVLRGFVGYVGRVATWVHRCVRSLNQVGVAWVEWEGLLNFGVGQQIFGLSFEWVGLDTKFTVGWRRSKIWCRSKISCGSKFSCTNLIQSFSSVLHDQEHAKIQPQCEASLICIMQKL